MRMKKQTACRMPMVLLAAAMALQGCDDKPANAPQDEAQGSASVETSTNAAADSAALQTAEDTAKDEKSATGVEEAAKDNASTTVAEEPTKESTSTEVSASADASKDAFQPMTVKHKLGVAEIGHRPQRVVALDVNELDFLNQLDVPVVATVFKNYIPHFLARYRDDSSIQDLGLMIQPDMERIRALHPDLVLMTAVQAADYDSLSELAPTLYFDLDYKNSKENYLETIKDHFLSLGKIFGKEDVARQKAAELDAKVAEVRSVTDGRPERALILMYKNGAFTSFGKQSRYGFVFDAFGVQPASAGSDSNQQKQLVSSEFIEQADPDIIYVIDRMAAMKQAASADNADNSAVDTSLLEQTKAWKNHKVIFVDPEAWFVTAASVTPLEIIADDIVKGYTD